MNCETFFMMSELVAMTRDLWRDKCTSQTTQAMSHNEMTLV